MSEHSTEEDASVGSVLYDRDRHRWTKQANGWWLLRSIGVERPLSYIEATYGPLTTAVASIEGDAL